MGVFAPALAEMDAQGTWFRDPEPFVSYIERNGLHHSGSAAPKISVDSLERLDPELRSARVMVFRLGGNTASRFTQFAMARSEQDDFSDFFLLDDVLFKDVKPRLFLPSTSIQKLFAFTLLPKFTETSLVNLAIYSGALAHALQFDPDAPVSAPATGQSTYTFKVSPRLTNSPVWEHLKGQVEVDGLFTGRKDGAPVAVIVESKVGDKIGSLAKHKLIYPFLALRPHIPEYIPIILVYLKANRGKDGFHFRIAQYETKFADRAIAGNRDFASCLVSHLVLSLHL